MWVGYLLGKLQTQRRYRRHKKQPQPKHHHHYYNNKEDEVKYDGGRSSATTTAVPSSIDNRPHPSPPPSEIDKYDTVGTSVPSFVNYGLSKLWKVFQKNSQQFTLETIQPILDKAMMEHKYPQFVQRVRIVRYVVGDQAPILQEFQPVPSRSINEMQCTFRLLYSSTSNVDLEIDVSSSTPSSSHENNSTTTTTTTTTSTTDSSSSSRSSITIPVTIQNLQLETLVWSTFSLVPYKPYCTSWTYSLLETPNVTFDMKVGRRKQQQGGIVPPVTFPITDIPFLRQFLFDLLCQEIPRECRFPRSNTVYFLPDEIRTQQEQALRQVFHNTENEDETTTNTQSVETTTAIVRDAFPEQWRLYQALDWNHDERLTRNEFVQVMEGWGYTTSELIHLFDQMKAMSSSTSTSSSSQRRRGSDTISFPQFCQLWPKVTAYTVPEDYEGVLSVSVQGIQGVVEANRSSSLSWWRRPFIHSAEEKVMVRLQVGNETKTTTTTTTDESSSSSLELLCQSIDTQQLHATVWKQENPGFFSFFKGRNSQMMGETSLPLQTIPSFSTKRESTTLHLPLETPGGTTRRRGSSRNITLTLEASYTKYADQWDMSTNNNHTAFTTPPSVDILKTFVVPKDDNEEEDDEP
jgi:hypothetical protein